MLVFLISVPRNLTTLFEKSVEQLDKFHIIHEAWCLYFWINKGWTTENKEIIPPYIEQYSKSDFFDYAITRSKDEPIFIKDFSYSLYDIFIEKQELIQKNVDKIKFVFLMREPLDAITSFHKICPAEYRHMMDMQMRYDLLLDCHTLCEKLSGESPLILSSEQLKTNPTKIMKKFCKYTNISFDEKMLSWEPNVTPKRWEVAKEWHMDVIKSSGFENRQLSSSVINYMQGLTQEEQDHINRLYQQQLGYYHKLKARQQCQDEKVNNFANSLKFTNSLASAYEQPEKDREVISQVQVGMIL